MEEYLTMRVCAYNFSMADCNFYVDEKKRVVVCVLEDTELLFINYAQNYLNFSSWDCNRIIDKNNKLVSKLKMPNKFTGIAKCALEDTWDEAIGRRIAYTKMREKVYSSFFNHARAYINCLDSWLANDIDNINAFGGRLENEFSERHKYITELVGEKDT